MNFSAEEDILKNKRGSQLVGRKWTAGAVTPLPPLLRRHRLSCRGPDFQDGRFTPSIGFCFYFEADSAHVDGTVDLFLCDWHDLSRQEETRIQHDHNVFLRSFRPDCRLFNFLVVAQRLLKNEQNWTGFLKGTAGDTLGETVDICHFVDMKETIVAFKDEGERATETFCTSWAMESGNGNASSKGD